jgi:hypothetical protein
MRKSLVLIGLPLLLGGCGLPPALTAASWALDGVSYLVSGKSVTDHAISEVAAQDCALFRVVQGREVCEDYEIDGDSSFTLTALVPDDRSQAAVLPPEMTEIVAGFGPGTSGDEQASSDAALVPVALRLQPDGADEGNVDPAWTVVPKARPVVPIPRTHETDRTAKLAVIGSFADPDNASGLRERHTALQAEIRTIESDGRTWHRVVVRAALADLRDAGFTDAWLLPQNVRSEPVLVAAAN